MKKLYKPRGLTINFAPSERQMDVWNTIQPNRCDKCGGELEMKLTGYDSHNNPIHEPTCKNCGNTDIPENILMGGAAGGGKSYLGSAWLISSCIRYPNILMVVARLTLKDLRATTWTTILRILGLWGFIEDENYHINNQYGYIDFGMVLEL